MCLILYREGEYNSISNGTSYFVYLVLPHWPIWHRLFQDAYKFRLRWMAIVPYHSHMSSDVNKEGREDKGGIVITFPIIM